VEAAVDIFYDVILFYLEPLFHPLIREGRKKFLIKVAHQFIFAQETSCCKPLEPESPDFPGHLQPYASSYIYRMKSKSEYFKAQDQVRLHQMFDQYLASGELDDDVYKFMLSQDKSVLEFDKKSIMEFINLEDKLIKLSFEDRAQIVNIQRQIDIFSENLKNITANEELKVCLRNLVHELKEEGFFDVDDDSIDWGKKCFVSLIDKFKDLIFKGHDCPRYLAIHGIMEYWIISQRSDITGQVAFEKVIEGVCKTWKKYIAELWMGTRYYKESYHDFLRNPLKKILPRNYGRPLRSKARTAADTQV